MSKNWIQGAIKNPGSLHAQLGIPEGQKIPTSTLERAKKSDNEKLRKRAILAETLGKFHK